MGTKLNGPLDVDRAGQVPAESANAEGISGTDNCGRKVGANGQFCHGVAM